MIKELGAVVLRSGGKCRFIRVLGPDVTWSDRIKPFLAHKGFPWRWQIAMTLEHDLSPLEAYYYLALVGDEVAGSFCTFEYGGAGILGHVFTSPAHRRKGICSSIMDLQMADYRSRGGKALFLHTGYDSPAYHIYKSRGFQSVYNESGFMEYYADGIDAFEELYSSTDETKIRKNDWRDWPGLTGLMSQRAGSHLRMVAMNILGRQTMEGPYLIFKKRQEEDRSSSMSIIENQNRLVCGYASKIPDKRFPGTWIFDLFVHPSHIERAADLAQSLSADPENGKVQSYVEIANEVKIQALEAVGFTREAKLLGQMVLDGSRVDLLVYSR